MAVITVVCGANTEPKKNLGGKLHCCRINTTKSDMYGRNRLISA